MSNRKRSAVQEQEQIRVRRRGLTVNNIAYVGSIDLTVRCPFCRSPFKTQITYLENRRLCPACHAMITMNVVGEAVKEGECGPG